MGIGLAILTTALPATMHNDHDKENKMDEYLRVALDTLGTPVYIKNTRHEIIFSNKAYRNISATIKNTSIATFAGFPQNSDNAKDTDVLENGVETLQEEEFRNTTGSTHTALIKRTPFRSTDGSNMLVGVITEITELKRTVSRLEFFRWLVDQSTDAFFITDLTGKILDINEAAVRTLGYSKQELLNMHINEIEVTFKGTDRHEKLAEKIRHVGQLVTAGRQHRKDGTSFPVEVTSRCADFGGNKYVISVIRDTTDREATRKAAEEIASLQELIPICCNCKSIRNDKGYWEKVEKYFSKRGGLKFTHGLCENCAKKLYGEM